MTDFHKLLLEIDGELKEDNLESLKFLCLPFTKRRSTSRVTSGLELFEILENNGLITRDNLSYLYGMLRTIGRRDLSDLIETKSNIQVDGSPECLRCNEFKLIEILFELSEDMVPENISSLRYLFASIPRGKRISTGIELFSALIDRDLLGPRNLQPLIDNLTAIGRKDLTLKLKDFKDIMEGQVLAQGSEIPDCLKAAQEVKHPVMVSDASYSYSSSSSSSFSSSLLLSSSSTLKETQCKSAVNYYSDDLMNRLSSVEISDKGQNSKGLDSDDHCCDNKSTEMPLKSVMQGGNASKSENLTVHLSPCESDDLNTETQSDNCDFPRYKMTATPRGICLVINNKDFTHDPNDKDAKMLRPRRGSDKDTENISKCFTLLKFDVRIAENLTDMAMQSTLNHYATDSNANKCQDCFVAFILSHGGTDQGKVFLYGSNGRKVWLDSITGMFRPDSCPSLTGKPKLFFLVSCLGLKYSKAVPSSLHLPETDSGIQTDSSMLNDQQDVEEEEEINSFVCNDQDFLIGYSTVIGNVGFRDTHKGTWYITALTDILTQYHTRESLQHMLVAVNHRVATNKHSCVDEQGKHGDYTQVPAPQHTLTKQLWFSSQL